MSKPKNISAFPQLTWECPQGATTAFHFTRGGLSKRELFAAMALQGLLAGTDPIAGAEEFAVRTADRLIQALEDIKP